MNIGKRNIAIIGALLLSLFSWYWCSVTLFPHEHFVDGERIMHSHPLAGSSHSHSSSQVHTIFYMAMFLALVAPLGVLLRRFDEIKSEIAINLTERIATVDNLVYSLRAPPTVLL